MPDALSTSTFSSSSSSSSYIGSHQRPMTAPSNPQTYKPSSTDILSSNLSGPQHLPPEIDSHHAKTQSGMPQTQEKGGPTATAPFLEDYSLIAEAAKRAQMAVMMRDLEGVSLS